MRHILMGVMMVQVCCATCSSVTTTIIEAKTIAVKLLDI
jgi:hypothetical protein